MYDITFWSTKAADCLTVLRRVAELASVTGIGPSGDYSLAALGDQS